jgi:diacylglycerol kinase (ATP)
VPVVLVGNSRSGRGVARRLFQRLHDRLEAAGFPVIPLALGDPGFTGLDRYNPARFRGATALVACGGDGTVNALAAAAARTATPLYHIPTGNENLFARSFRMTRDPAQLVRALQTRRVIMTDTAACADGGRPEHQFLIMLGVGPDASVIRRLHAARTRAIGHLAYAEPIVRETLAPCLPRLQIAVDGTPLVHDRQGWLIVGNHRHYASRVDFASHATPTSGDLDVIFMPARNLRDCLNWVCRARLRLHRRDPRLINAFGRRVEITSADPAFAYQVDGEAPEAAGNTGPPPGPRSLVVTLNPRALPVLVP